MIILQNFIDKFPLTIWYLSGLIGIVICIYYINWLAGEKYPFRKWLTLVILGAFLGWIVFAIGMFILIIVLLAKWFNIPKKEEFTPVLNCPFEDVECPHLGKKDFSCKDCGLEV